MRLAKRLPRPVRFIIRTLTQVAVGGVLIIATLLLAQAFADRRFADLEPWQSDPIDGEFKSRDDSPAFTLADYLKIEDELFAGVKQRMRGEPPTTDRSDILRYVQGSRSDPFTFDINWNRTREIEPASIEGGVLLLHGLSDSPYSMRTMAQMFAERGCYALCLRIPGHGTIPAGLLDVSWEDWMAAVRVGMRAVRAKVGPDKPIYLCGYSNGGALATLYTLQAADRNEPLPAHVFLFSPAIAVTPFARASNWHMLYSWIPYFKKSKWLSVEPEYDPFKYCSFTKNAGRQVWSVTKQVQRELSRAESDGRLQRLPPITTFQSAVDATIIAADVVQLLYDRLPANGSELVVFDVNRQSLLDGLYRQTNLAIDHLLHRAPVNYSVTLVRNASPDSRRATTLTRPAGAKDFQATAIDAEWPESVYSLAHVAIPFPPDDPVYGVAPPTADSPHVRLGDLSLRGEKNVLVLSAADMLRLRHNPFHQYMLQRMREAMNRSAAADAP